MGVLLIKTDVGANELYNFLVVFGFMFSENLLQNFGNKVCFYRDFILLLLLLLRINCLSAAMVNKFEINSKKKEKFINSKYFVAFVVETNDYL